MRITAAPKPSAGAPLAVILSAVWKTKARQAGYSRVCLIVLWKFEFLKLCNHEKPLNATPYPRRAPKRVRRRAAQAELGTICG